MSKDVATLGKGFKLGSGNGDGPPETYADIKGIQSPKFNPPGAASPEKVKVTSGSTTGNIHEYIDGWSDRVPGELTCELVFDGGDSTHGRLESDYEVGTERTYQLTVPVKTGGTKIATVEGRLSKFEISSDIEGVVKASLALSFIEDTFEWAP